MPARRKAKRRLPRSLRKAIQKKENPKHKSEALPPVDNKIKALEPPPEVLRVPEPKPELNDSESTALVPARRSLSPQRLLESMGQQALVGREMEGACNFWIELKEDILGGVEIRLSIANGQLSATLLVKNEESESLLRQKLFLLKKQLSDRGLRVKNLEIVCSQKS